MLTASAEDTPTENGEDKDDDGCNNDHLFSGHVLPHTVAVQLRPAIGKGKGRRGGSALHNPSQLTRLVVGGLPCAGQESVVAAWSALRDELRLVPRLVIDRTEI